jgi:hypothetical protein
VTVILGWFGGLEMSNYVHGTAFFGRGMRVWHRLRGEAKTPHVVSYSE